MKRLPPPSLYTFWQNNTSCYRAYLFVITLPTGTTFYTTDQQWDITVLSSTGGWSGGMTTFSATNYGRWSCGSITSEAGFDFKGNSMTLTCVPQPSTQYPGIQVGMLNAALNGLFDAATVTVYAAYMPIGGYGNVSAGLETKFSGIFLKFNDNNRTKVEFEVGDWLYTLNEKVPKRLIQADCPWNYGDANCNPTGGIKQQTFTVAAGTTQWLLIPSTATGNLLTAGYYTQGFVKCTNGAVGGLTQTVQVHASSGQLQLEQPFIITPNVGDTFVVTAGCDNTLTTCTQKFGNQSHFGGIAFTPPSSTGTSL